MLLSELTKYILFLDDLRHLGYEPFILSFYLSVTDLLGLSQILKLLLILDVLGSDLFVHLRYTNEIIQGQDERYQGESKNSNDVQTEHWLSNEGISFPAVSLLQIQSHFNKVSISVIKNLL